MTSRGSICFQCWTGAGAEDGNSVPGPAPIDEANANRFNESLLVIFAIPNFLCIPMLKSCACRSKDGKRNSASRIWVGIAGWFNGPQRHHGMVFMDHIVAMQRVSPRKVAEAEENLHAFIVVKLHNIFTRFLNRQRRRSAISGNNL